MAIEVPPQVAERLAKEHIIWLTTTRLDGMPLPNPVWFLWNGRQFLVFTEPGSVKMKNMARNPRVALNFNSDFDGGDVAIFQAEADLSGAPVSDSELNDYLSKYKEGLQSIGITAEVLTASYRLVRLMPIKYRTAS
jgi:PPOX class probable F420-dependent enzyme